MRLHGAIGALLFVAFSHSMPAPFAQSAEPLRADTRLSRSIGTESPHRFALDLAAATYVEIEVFQRGRDIAVSLADVAGNVVADVDNPLGGFGPETLAVVIERPGAYILSIRPSRSEGPTGSYDLRVVAMRSAAAHDALRAESVRRLLEGELARAKGTGESMKQARAHFEAALAASEQIADRPRETAARLGLARVLDNTGEKRRAVDAYADVRARYHALGDVSNEAFTLNLAAVVHDFLGERDKAMQALTEALPLAQQVGDVRVEALSTGNTGLIYFQTGDRIRALEWYTRALPLHRKADNRRGEAVTLTNLGSTNDAIGEKDTSLAFFTEALALRRLLGEPREQAVILNNMGALHFSRDRYREALEVYDEALLAWRAAGDRAGEAATLHNIANVREFLGEYQQAIDLWSQALELQRSVAYRTGEANTLANRGRLFMALGDFEQARLSLERSLTLQREVDSRSGEAATLLNLANVFAATGDPARAIAFFEETLPLMRAVGNRGGEASALQALGRLQLASHDAAAETTLKKSADLFRATDAHIGEAVSLAHLGRARIARGDLDAGSALLEEALSIARRIGHATTEAAVLHTIARVERDRGDLAAAHRHATSALDIVESLRANVSIHELRSTYLATMRDYYELAVDVLMRLDEKEPSKGFALSALQISERARSRSLLDVLAYAQQELRQSADPELMRQMRETQAALNIKAERLRRLMAGSPPPAEVKVRKDEIAALTLQFRELEARIRRSSARDGALVSVDAAPVADLQKGLEADTTLVEYMLADERSFVWVLTRDALHSAVLPPRREIDAAARSFAAAAAAPDDPNLNPAASRLADVLLAPIPSSLRRERIVIVPDGALAYVPFAALPDRRDGSGSVPLIASHDIVSAPSASTVALLRADVRQRQPRRTLAIFADPVYSSLDARVRPAGASEAKGPLPLARDLQRALEDAGSAAGPGELARLIGSRREAAALMSLVPESSRTVAMDFAANRRAVSHGDLENYRLLHFATHALIDNTHPELSGIVLSLVDEKGAPQDGFLRLHEIYDLKLSADLVVLSACQTALGQEIRGEGLIGLTRGFLHAGAKRVVASLWKVDDRATAELMQRFYAAMLGPERQSPRTALRTAQRAMLTQKRWQSPYYWAGFILHGDWQ